MVGVWDTWNVYGGMKYIYIYTYIETENENENENEIIFLYTRSYTHSECGGLYVGHYNWGMLLRLLRNYEFATPYLRFFFKFHFYS